MNGEGDTNTKWAIQQWGCLVILLLCVSTLPITMIAVLFDIQGKKSVVVAFESSINSYLPIINQALQLPAKELRGLVNSDFDLFLSSGRSSVVKPGRMLVLDMKGKKDVRNLESVELSEVFFTLSKQYRANNPAEVDTIILLAHTQEFLQPASGTQGARYREIMTIWLIDRSTASLLWVLEIQAPEPSFSLPQLGSGAPSPNRSFVDCNKLAQFLGRLSEGEVRPAGTFVIK